METRKIVGVDFGGTKIKAGVITENGELISDEILLPTESQRIAEKITDTMKTCIEEAVESSGLKINDILGIGIGSPGPLDLKQGIILDTPNLPTMINFPLKKTISDHFGKPVELNNDGNCFVLGEACFGAGQAHSIVCGVTLGTGFGCGIVFDRTIYVGSSGTAAEVWCSPYADSNFEEYGAARAVQRFYKNRTGQEFSAKRIFELASNNDQNALNSFNEFGKNLGRILAIMVNILDPNVFVIGGSVSNAWDYFQDSLIKNLRANINAAPREHLQVEKAHLGDNAGLFGAAALLL